MTDLDVVRAWGRLDADPANRAEVDELLGRGDSAEIDDRFGRHLRFGTAGLRGRLGAGPNRMNVVTVARVAVALTRWSAAPRVVIGYDARHGSHAFAEITARLITAAGGEALWFDDIVPTPVLAFSVQDAAADLGVMVTASHNPPGDNGYKVYLADGAQLVPPVDTQIEDLMTSISLDELSELIESASAVALPPPVDRQATIERYLDRVVDDGAVGEPVVAYTPLHGVGRDVFEQALSRVGLRATAVPTQADPDPTFATVSFPNPEEPGALDALLALAESIGADVALAHDPDADRLAVAVPSAGGWEVLSGNELGALLADHRLETTEGDDRLVVTTVVSSRLLAKLAEAHHVTFTETLTGFKWVMRPAIDGPHRFVFGYEEALGYAVNAVVRDKDGISAGVTFLQLLERLGSQHRTPRQRLDDLARIHGVHVSGQRTIVFDGPNAATDMAAVMQRTREQQWQSLGDVAVDHTVDFADGSHDPGTDLLRFDLSDGSRIQIRPSGTEPKLKIYSEVVLAVEGPDADVGARRDEARQHGERLLSAAAVALS
ncbi:MAG: phospho-sugar mutase [Acidimicrobiales bacterium]